MPGWASYLWYEFVFWASLMVMTLGWSLRVRGRQHIPRHGPVLIVANHQSFLDPVLVGLSAPRHLCFLARQTLFRPGFGALIRSLNAVPIDHQHLGKAGLQAALDQLARGQAVVVFPEGTRSPDGTLHSLKPGISLLIKRARAPVVVVGIAGAHDAWPRTQPLPVPAPLFWPASGRTIAVQVGPCRSAAEFERRSREEVLDLLFQDLARMTEQAEQLRRH